MVMKIWFGIIIVIVFLIIGIVIGTMLFSKTKIIGVDASSGDFCFDKNYKKILDIYGNEVDVYEAQNNNAVEQVFANCDPNFGEVLWLFESCTRGKLVDQRPQNAPDLNGITSTYEDFGK